jgi:hypothetical protein
MLCIDYYEARQRKHRANSWNDCHSRVEVSRQQTQKKICLDFVHARFNASVWLQAGQYLALAAQIPAKQKSGCPRLRAAERVKKAAVLAYAWYSGLRPHVYFSVCQALPLNYKKARSCLFEIPF